MLARWHLRVGDPDAISWFIVFAYAVAFVLALRAYRSAKAAERLLSMPHPDESRSQRSMKQLWLLITVTVCALGINKQLELQTLAIQTVRDRAYAHGWYGRRREYQVAFILAVILVGVIGTTLAVVWLRGVFRRVWLAIAGISMLVVFVIVRAASFHYVDKVLALGSVRINHLLELSGIGMIAVAALVWQHSEGERIGALTRGPQTQPPATTAGPPRRTGPAERGATVTATAPRAGPDGLR